MFQLETHFDAAFAKLQGRFSGNIDHVQHASMHANAPSSRYCSEIRTHESQIAHAHAETSQ